MVLFYNFSCAFSLGSVLLFSLVIPALSAPTSQYDQPNRGSALLVEKDGKPLVSSSALQSDVSSAALLDRANILFDISKSSIDEYGHPTRTIGSAGQFDPYSSST